jgi:hypothetical protein
MPHEFAKTLKSVSRGRKLTAAEARKYARLRRRAEAERPEIIARLQILNWFRSAPRHSASIRKVLLP